MVDTLLLTTRSSVPSGVAYLRSRFPADGWRAHPNYGQLTAFWLHVHANLRMGSAQLQEALDAFRMDPCDPRAFGRRFAPGLAGFHQHLDAHHRIEDQAYFPKFRAIDPRMAIAFDMLESDHAIIHAAIERSLRSARQLLASLDAGGDPVRFAADRHAHDSGRLSALLVRHLADEEDIVVPAMLEFGERSVA
ncbi:MAG TPA: hemerythrin domain-containing protein [Luteimonas sp.]|nr:hemerythrin domain-containing protein [Luteimonas sp.]